MGHGVVNRGLGLSAAHRAERVYACAPFGQGIVHRDQSPGAEAGSSMASATVSASFGSIWARNRAARCCMTPSPAGGET